MEKALSSKWTRKAALENMPVACFNRRGFSAEKRVRSKNLIPDRQLYGGLAQLGERLPCKQEAIGSIPIISTTRSYRSAYLKR